MLKNNFASFAEAWRANEIALASCGLNQLALKAILWKRPSLDPDREMEKMVRENIWVITENDSGYPKLLKEIHNPPLALYGRGDPKILAEDGKIKIAVVGTRRPTAYGLEAADKIVRELSEAGLVVVSGLASGIDTRAHESALDSGKTIAVLGSGTDRNSIFPPENKNLAGKIAEGGGVIISEYAPGTPAVKEHFPQRNRIISGLSQGTLVVEAREKSGALITARLALEQNREVFALPGSIFSPTSAGPHKIIQEGAKLATSAQDILEELGMDYNKERRARNLEVLDERERTLLEFLEEPLNVDALKEKTGLETSVIVSSLSMLELKNLIKNLGGDTYQKT